MKQREESFKPFIDIVFEYTKKNELVLVEDNFTYFLYSSNALYDTNELANMFAEITPYVQMNTTIIQLLFEIRVNFITFIKIFNVRKVRDVNIITQLGERIPGTQPARDVLHLSREIEIIKVYNDLYDFSQEDKWDDLYEKEEELFAIISRDYPQKQGGAQPNQKKQLELFTLLTQMNCIFIGVYGASFMTNLEQKSKIQIITDDLQGVAKKIIEILAKSGIGANIKFDKSFEMIEHRLQVAILESNGVIFAEIFNAASYELLMCKHLKPLGAGAHNTGARVAHPYVICKFLFLELFKFRLLAFAERIDRKVYELKKIEVIDIVSKIREFTFETFDVYGRYYDEVLAIKHAQLKSPAPYWPRKHFVANGKYRVISRE